MWLLAIFILVPMIEIALFIQVGSIIGLWPTLLIVLLSAIIGTMLMRSQGARAWNEVQHSFSDMRDPSRPLAHGMMILIAGMLLLTPGFFTDTIGLLLLIPGVRDAVIRGVARNIQVRNIDTGSWSGQYKPGQQANEPPRHQTHGRPPHENGTIIDGEYIIEDEEAPNRPTPPDVEPESKPYRGNSGWTRH